MEIGGEVMPCPSVPLARSPDERVRHARRRGCPLSVVACVEKATLRATSPGRPRSVARAASSPSVGWLNTIVGATVATSLEPLDSGFI